MTHATATVDLMRPPFPAEPGSGVYSNKLGMWVFLASDVMFFTALIGTYIILRFGVSQPWAHPNAVLNVPLTAFNTFLLICSSVSMVKAFAAISQGDQRGLKLWLLITILAGASFVSVQVVEYIKLVGHGFTPAEVLCAFEMPISQLAKIVCLLVLAVVKALLVALFFMHLKFERWRLRVVFMIPLPLAAILVLAVITEKLW